MVSCLCEPLPAIVGFVPVVGDTAVPCFRAVLAPVVPRSSFIPFPLPGAVLAGVIMGSGSGRWGRFILGCGCCLFVLYVVIFLA